MAKRKWNEAVDNGIDAFLTGDYVYLYGAKNVRLTTESQIREYFRREPEYFNSHYNAEELSQIVRNSLGHMADDCSGYTGWVCTGDKQYSIGQINNCAKYNSLANGPTGSILFTTWGGRGRHIGMDVGSGKAMHMGYESTDENIRLGRAGIIFEPITARAWEKSGESNVIDYTGAYSPYPRTTELWERLHPSPTPTPPIEMWVGEVYGKQLVTVYQNPTGATPLNGYPALALGNLFEVIGDSGNRWQIKIANQYTGYIDKQYVLRKTPYGFGTVTTDLHLRQNAGATYKSITIMPKNARVQLCDQKPSTTGAKWFYVIYNGTYGFCSAKYVLDGTY